MSFSRSRLTLLACLVAAGGGLACWIHGISQSPAPAQPNDGADRSSPNSTPLVEMPAGTVTRPGKPLPPDATPASFEELRDWIDSLQNDESVAWIRSFLKTGNDKDTGLSFEVAAAGSLTEWPTFRTYLLDKLSTIDPSAAAAISRDILADPTTADEWALALRNVGRAEDSDRSRDFLREKTVELIRNPDWQASPSIGYLNAFDVLVHTNATTETPLLSELIQNKDRRDLAHAAFLTLDRLVQREPADVLHRLSNDSALASSRPEMTAQQFARADLRDEGQRELVAQWLLSTERTPAELNSFAGVFPNHNQFVSNNLLTRDAPIPGPELAAFDREVLEIVTAWQADPEFQPVGDQLLTMIERLSQFTSSSGQ